MTNSLWIEARTRLRQVARGLVGRELRARIASSDLVQLTLLQAQDRLSQVRGNSVQELPGWLQRILENTSSAQWRHYSRLRRHTALGQPLKPAESLRLHPDTEPTGQPGGDGDVLVSREDAKRLRLTIDQLPEEQRIAVTLRHLRGAVGETDGPSFWTLLQSQIRNVPHGN